MKIKTSLIVLMIIIFSCQNEKTIKEYYPNGEIKSEVMVNSNGIRDGGYKAYYNTGELMEKMIFAKGKVIDTVMSFHKNGIIREKGLFNNKGLKIGWWFYYNNKGLLNNKEQYKVIRDSMYKNQTLYYNSNGDINYEKSSFFIIDIPDTLFLGRNKGQLQYYSNFKKENREIFGVVIENEYSDNLIKKDTFWNGTDNLPIGIYAHKTGEKVIKGMTIETVSFIEKNKIDSLTIGKIAEHKKYFQKRVFIKDTIN